MKFNRVIKEDYTKIIGQIDSLKNNIAQLIQVNQDNHPTSRFNPNKINKSPQNNTRKTSRLSQKKVQNSKSIKKQVKKNKQNIKTQQTQTVNTNKLLSRMIQIEQSNEQMKRFTLVLQQMLRKQRQKRIRLEKKLKDNRQKSISGGQINRERHSSSFKVFTPYKYYKQNSKELIKNKQNKQIKLKDQGQIESFLLGDCDHFLYSSPKKRNTAQIEIMELLQQLSRNSNYQKKQQLKILLLQAVKKFIRK